MGFLLPLSFTAALIVAGFVVGKFRERAHLRELDQREAASSVVVVDVRALPPGMEQASGALVTGEVVIAADYFKSFVARIRGIIGGEVRTYQTMLSRARREARMRMVEQAEALGAQLIVNVRFEWSEVGPRLPSAEIFCYGTAIIAPSA